MTVSVAEVAIKPGVLVSLKTENRGNTKYFKETLQYPTAMPGGAVESEWSTRKRVSDPDEQDRANKVRDKARSMITGVCAKSKHGLLCPLEDKALLLERIDDARELVDDFNREAMFNHVELNVIYGEVMQNDVEATRAIFNEISRFLSDMEEGLVELDVEKVRRICDRAVNMNKMLDGDASERLELVIGAARSACKRIVKAGDAVVGQMERNTVNLIKSARTSFLDLDSPDAVVGRPSTGAGRSLDMVV